MKGLDRLVDVNRYRPRLEIQPEAHPRVERGRLNAQSDGGEERSGRRTCLGEQLDGRTDADGPFDADHCRFSELDVDVVVVSQRRPDDLFLHLTVERHEYLLPAVVLPHVDQGVLLGELGERDVQRAFVGGEAGNDDRFQRRRGEIVALRGRPRFADRVPIRPAATDARWTAEARSKTLIAVTFSSSSPPSCSRSRTLTVPENMRT